MTDRSKLLALADAVEKLTGPDRRTDYLVMTATVRPGRGYIWDPEGSNHRFTSSIDSAMTLVPKGKDVMFAVIDGCAYAGIGKERSDADIEAATLPLALCAAALRAQAEALA